jgi:hypothetical protein
MVCRLRQKLLNFLKEPIGGGILAPAALLLYARAVWIWDHTQGSQKMLCVVAALVDQRGLTDKWKVPWPSKDLVDERALRWRIAQLK